MTPRALARRAASRMLRSRPVHRAVRALARARGHRLALVYHRVGVVAATDRAVVPTVPEGLFRAQVEALGEVVDLVTLDDALADDDGRVKVALTFDDDLPSHATHALPALRALRVPAAFFLSGRVLHGLGAYWFQQLEGLLGALGVPRTAALLGVDAPPTGLAAACERDAGLRRRIAELAADFPDPDVLEREGIGALAAAGMTIGFHTLDHGVLPTMDDAALADALTRGRDRLASAASSSLRHFAYPHGKADRRSATAVRRAGFAAAWTGRPAPLAPGDDPHRLGRWEPGPLGVDDLLVALAIRLHRVAPPDREMPA